MSRSRQFVLALIAARQLSLTVACYSYCLVYRTVRSKVGFLVAWMGVTLTGAFADGAANAVLNISGIRSKALNDIFRLHITIYVYCSIPQRSMLA